MTIASSASGDRHDVQMPLSSPLRWEPKSPLWAYRTVPLSWQHWLLIFSGTSVVLWFGELWRQLRSRPQKNYP